MDFSELVQFADAALSLFGRAWNRIPKFVRLPLVAAMTALGGYLESLPWTFVAFLVVGILVFFSVLSEIHEQYKERHERRLSEVKQRMAETLNGLTAKAFPGSDLAKLRIVNIPEGQSVGKESGEIASLKLLIAARDKQIVELTQDLEGNDDVLEAHEDLSHELKESEKKIEELQSALFAAESSVSELRAIRQQYKRHINWLRFRYEEAPQLVSALGHVPSIRIQYYLGQNNRELAAKAAQVFVDLEWEVVSSKEVSSTNLGNTQKGRRIMISYPYAKIGVFHNAIRLLESASSEQVGFFDPEMVIPSVREEHGDNETVDLVVTIFPKNFWD